MKLLKTVEHLTTPGIFPNPTSQERIIYSRHFFKKTDGKSFTHIGMAQGQGQYTCDCVHHGYEDFEPKQMVAH